MGALRTDEGLQQTRSALVINSREREERQFCICTEPDRPFDTEMIRPDPDRFGRYHQYQTEDRSTLWLPRRAHLRFRRDEIATAKGRKDDCPKIE